jgi:hypothetical protein
MNTVIVSVISDADVTLAATAATPSSGGPWLLIAL